MMDFKKKEQVSFILAILILMLHTNVIEYYSDYDVYNYIYNFNLLKKSIAQVAVPLFFIISGASSFCQYSNQKYTEKLKKIFLDYIFRF